MKTKYINNQSAWYTEFWLDKVVSIAGPIIWTFTAITIGGSASTALFYFAGIISGVCTLFCTKEGKTWVLDKWYQKMGYILSFFGSACFTIGFLIALFE